MDNERIVIRKGIIIFSIFLISFLTQAADMAFFRLGSDIEGSEDDNTGYSVSLSQDGRFMAIASIQRSHAGNEWGFVRAYEWNGSLWSQIGEDIIGEQGGHHFFGEVVSLCHGGGITRVAVSVGIGMGINKGYVRVYEWNGDVWDQVGDDIVGAAIRDDHFGESISLSQYGNLLAIGARGNDANGTNSGHVQVYAWNGGSWVQLGSDIEGEAEGDRSGKSVSLSSSIKIEQMYNGVRLAIGATGNDGNGNDSGHVRVYEWNGFLWSQIGDDIDGEVSFDYSGISVSLSSTGQRVAIGATGSANDFGSNGGQVRVYEWNGASWMQLGQDIDGQTAQEMLGYTVSLNGDGTIVASGAIGSNSETGIVRVYKLSGSGSYWGPDSGYSIEGESQDEKFGRTISISSSGEIIAIGAPWKNGNAPDSGHVSVHEFASDVSTINKLSDRIASLQNTLNTISLNNSSIASNTANISSTSNSLIAQIENNDSDINSLYLNSYLFDARTTNNSNEIENIKSDIIAFEDRLNNSDLDLNDIGLQINTTSNALAAAIDNVITLKIALANLLNLEVTAREAADANLSNRIDTVESETNVAPSVAQAKAMMKDLRAGSTIIDVSDQQATLTISLDQSSDLTSNWTENVISETMTIPVTNNVEFFRFRMD